jgi:beta-galactosidase
MAHILPHWNWPDRIGQITPVHVYTSGDEAELFLNGRSLGKKVKGAYQYRLRWDDVKYAPGEVKVIAYKAGKEWAVESVRTTGPASRLALSADRAKIAADGRDLSFVAVSVVDKDGLRVPTAGNPVHFRIDGPGVIAAMGNGDPTDHGSFQSDQTRSFHGKCLLIVRSIGGKTGLIRVAAKSDGLREASIVIRAK